MTYRQWLLGEVKNLRNLKIPNRDIRYHTVDAIIGDKAYRLKRAKCPTCNSLLREYGIDINGRQKWECLNGHYYVSRHGGGMIDYQSGKIVQPV